MLQDTKLVAAVARIVQRSERQEDMQKLIGTYVDVGLLPQLNNSNHQIFYGRRGTGKTHVMKVLESRLNEDVYNTVVYIDCRTLGSTSQFSDSGVPMHRRCLALFRDFLLCIHDALLEHIVEKPSARANEALQEVDNLINVITEPLQVLKAEKLTTHDQSSSTTKGGITCKGEVSLLSPTASMGASTEAGTSQTKGHETQYTFATSDKIIFPELLKALRKVLDLADSRLFVLVDEWSSLPIDVQPYLAEFLKRGLLPLNTATLKIAALEYRCRFSIRNGETLLGFELSADIATAPDLDNYFVFDRNPDQITDIYADVLLRHLSSELPEDYLKKTYSVSSARQLSSRLFTERNTCSELARASEGVIRDLINIFTQAFFNAHRRGRDSIDKKSILESASQWFEQDKAQYLDDHLMEVLRRIVDEVIGRKRARSFLLPRELEKNSIIQKLFDARVLHPMQKGYADKDNPGIRYNIYAIDYGTYVGLIGTSKEPKVHLEVENEEDDSVVPYDDKRSIRRIILNEMILR